MTGFATRRNSALIAAATAAVLLAWVAVAAPPRAEPDLPGAGERWIEVETVHFRLFSNAGTGATKRVAADLEELRAALAQLTDFELQSPVPTSIYVFKNDRSFSPYKILYDKRPGVMSGYFLEGGDANFIAIDAGSRDASDIVYHEYVHYVTANNFWWLPVWLTEGLAEFYQTLEVVGKTTYIGLPVNSYLARLRGSIPIPLADLLAVDHDSPLYNEKDRKSDFYAECWALTHYLLLGNDERRQQLGRYLALIGLGVPAETAFSDAFGPDLDALERDVRAHLRSPRFPILKATTRIDVDDSMTIRDMQYPDVLYRLGALLAGQVPERPEATAYFEAALAADPDHSPSLTYLALEAEERADWDAAAGYYRRAVGANPDDAEAWFHWGEFLSRQHEDSEEARASLTRATTLAPSFAPAWVALSRLYARLGETSPEAIVATETAHRLEPANRETTQNLLRLDLRLDRRAEAVELIDTAFPTSPRAKSEAWMAVLQNDLLRARELLHDGREADAAARLDAAERDLEMAARPQIIARSLARIRTEVSENRGSRIYDMALAEYDRGNPEAARALLEEALAELPPSGPVTNSCRHLLDVIDHPEKYAPPPPPRLSPTDEEIDRLNRMLAAGDLVGAVGFLNGIRDQASDPQQRWIDGKILELQQTIDYNRYVDSYNTAVDLYNRGDFSAAISVLDEYLEGSPDSPHAASARSLRKDAQRALEGAGGGG